MNPETGRTIPVQVRVRYLESLVAYGPLGGATIDSQVQLLQPKYISVSQSVIHGALTQQVP